MNNFKQTKKSNLVIFEKISFTCFNDSIHHRYIIFVINKIRVKLNSSKVMKICIQFYKYDQDTSKRKNHKKDKW